MVTMMPDPTDPWGKRWIITNHLTNQQYAAWTPDSALILFWSLLPLRSQVF